MSFSASVEQGAQKSEIKVRNESPLIQFVRGHQHLSLLEALERKIEDTPEGPAREKEVASRAEFERLGVALVAPVFSENHLVAVLTLGPKLSGDSFSNEDTQLIDVLAPQIGSAIQKANLYEEVRQFSAGLKVRVQEATKELQARNVSLQTLQTITKDITRTLDFGKVVQNIANAVATELGFLGAILIFLDDDGKTLRARAVTETPLTQKAMKLLPNSFTSYTTELTNPKQHTLAYDVITTGEIRFTDSMPDVISPPVPKSIVIMMQKLMGIKTMILVPIVSEEKVIGVIEVGVKRQRDQINQSEIETLQSMADELGVVARNIKLYEQIRQTNIQLEKLLEAQSEFLDIASHQLRTPVSVIRGIISMIQDGDMVRLPKEKQAAFIDSAAQKGAKLDQIINDILAASELDSKKFTVDPTTPSIQLENVVDQAVKGFKLEAEQREINMVWQLPQTPLPRVIGSDSMLEQAISNFISNALKYTPSTKMAKEARATRSAKGQVQIAVARVKDDIVVSVQDNGIGIPKDEANKLFRKFTRASNATAMYTDGSGLGLFIVKEIIEGHNGRVWLESVEGKGSTFYFSLPVANH